MVGVHFKLNIEKVIINMKTLKEINEHLDKLIAEDNKVINNAENELQKVFLYFYNLA